MKKNIVWINMIILIVMLIGCSQKQTVEKKENTQDTAVEVITSEEEINKDEFVDETNEDYYSNTDVAGDTSNANDSEVLEVNSIEPFEVEKAKVLERIESMEFTPSNYELIEVFKEIEFNQPLHLTYDYKGGQYIYIVEKQGLIKRISTTNNAMEIFLDLTKVVDSSENETGLLGMAFHPMFPEDPRLFLYYTEGNKVKIVSYEIVTSDEENEYVVAAENIVEILEFSQPYVNHNGGHMAFGSDGYLYIASGDGGSKGDPDNNAQNLTNLLGKILRIDINNRSDNENYSIPVDNPFVNDLDKRKEIFAYGLRNPWKFSFDIYRDLLLTGDVGQDAREEINSIEKGGNYGWSAREGTIAYNKKVTLDVNPIDPIYEYTHQEGKSITGGYTYYGEDLPSLFGVYVYGDFVSGSIWGLWIDQENQVRNELLLSTTLRIASFGIDAEQELYIVDYRGGIYQLKEE